MNDLDIAISSRRYRNKIMVIMALCVTTFACVTGTGRRDGLSDYSEPRLLSEGKIVVQCDPAECASDGTRGLVIMNVLVDTKGAVIEVEVAHSSIGDPGIISESIKAAYTTRWNPATLKGALVKAWARYQIEID